MTSEAATLSNAVIRPATEADLPACAGIVNDYIDAMEWLPRILPRETVAGMFTPGLLKKRRMFVADLAGAVAGYLSARPEGFVQALYLSPHARRRGIGRQLLDRAKALYPEQLELTVFEANAEAKRFYEREGFREVPEGREESSDEGIPTLLMRWRRGK